MGERGTGKTSLALAIAAQARVPVVNIKAQELEAGLWVGQSASNVRELFQTARELVKFIIIPLLIFLKEISSLIFLLLYFLLRHLFVMFRRLLSYLWRILTSLLVFEANLFTLKIRIMKLLSINFLWNLMGNSHLFFRSLN